MTQLPVCVFAKPPLAGQVKTRLAVELGERQAAALARAFFQDTWATVCALPWARPILASTSADVSSYGVGEVEVWLQGEGDLGARLERVTQRALQEAPGALLIGADLPGLPRGHLEHAREELSRAEVVLGPTTDGGFYLLGATRLREGALRGITWSASSTYAETHAAVSSAGHSVGLAPGWFDVDHPGDLQALRTLLRAQPDAAPRSRAVLEGLS